MPKPIISPSGHKVDEPPKPMGARELERWRVRQGLSIPAAARLTGISDESLRAWEAGKRTIPQWAANLVRLMPKVQP